MPVLAFYTHSKIVPALSGAGFSRDRVSRNATLADRLRMGRQESLPHMKGRYICREVFVNGINIE
jgi:hypothetical protein